MFVKVTSGCLFAKLTSAWLPLQPEFNYSIDAFRQTGTQEINIWEAISQLANVDEQLLLRFRYINNYGWEKIAVLMSVSMRTVHRIHASALRNFQPPV